MFSWLRTPIMTMNKQWLYFINVYPHFILIYLFKMYIYFIFNYMCIHTHKVYIYWDIEYCCLHRKSVWSPGVEYKSCCEPPDVGAITQTHVQWRSIRHSWPWVISLALWSCFSLSNLSQLLSPSLCCYHLCLSI